MSLVRVLYYKLLHRDGFFGVNGKHFHRLQIVRGAVETTLRSIQAYRMSAVLPRATVNHFFVTLLVINCWAPLFLHYALRRNEQRKRFLSLALDLLLDLVSSVGIPVTILVNYVGEYDRKLKGFPPALWYNDCWTARAINEFQLVLVMSGGDLFSRVWFSMGLVSTSTSMKVMLSQSVAATNRVIDAGPLQPPLLLKSTSTMLLSMTLMESRKATATDPFTAYTTRTTSSFASATSRVTTFASLKAAEASAVLQRRVQLKAAYYLLMAWGFVVLGLHIHAETMPALLQCKLQVRPWGVAQPSCYLVEVNCYYLGIEGSKAQAARQWSAFDRTSAVQMLVKHCPALEIPDMLQDFRNLNGLKIYNSTLVEWGADAAITRERHPSIITVFMVRVNLTDGEVPAGLLWHDFPPSLRDFEFVVTNLRAFPEDLDEIWPIGSMVYAEFSNLTALPAPLLRLQPPYLSVYGIPITHVPAELFEVDNLFMVHLGSTLISELPRNVTALSSTLSIVYLTDTNVPSFWSWADSKVDERALSFRAGGTPYCNALDRYTATGDRSGFPSPVELAVSPDYSVLMDPTQLELIQRRVACAPVREGLYPLAVEDLNSALDHAG